MFETTKDKRCITHTYIHTQRHHQYTSFGEFRRCETSGSDQKWEKLSQPKTYQSLFGPKLLIAHHFFTTQTFQSKNPTRNWYIYFSRKTKTQFRKQQNTQKPICRSPICECVWSFWGPEFWVFVVVVVVLESKHKGLQWNWNESEWKRGFILDAKVNKQRWKFPNSKWECLQPSNFLECCQWLRKPFLFSFFFGLNFCFLLFILFPFTFTSFFFLVTHFY